MLNAPYAGGTHLPDITVVSPVFVGDERNPSFFVASRAHHADIGGITPGSMPPGSRTIDEEGVLIDNFLLLDGGEIRERELRALLASGAWPARNPAQNVADLKAQSRRQCARHRRNRVADRAHGTRHGGALHGPRAGQCRGLRP